MRVTNAQRKKLCELMHFAFIEIRHLGWSGKAEQAADLADAFHNLPKDMWKEDFALEQFGDLFLKDCQTKYPHGKIQNYLAQVRKIIAMREDPSNN